MQIRRKCVIGYSVTRLTMIKLNSVLLIKLTVYSMKWPCCMEWKTPISKWKPSHKSVDNQNRLNSLWWWSKRIFYNIVMYFDQSKHMKWKLNVSSLSGCIRTSGEFFCGQMEGLVEKGLWLLFLKTNKSIELLFPWASCVTIEEKESPQVTPNGVLSLGMGQSAELKSFYYTCFMIRVDCTSLFARAWDRYVFCFGGFVCQYPSNMSYGYTNLIHKPSFSKSLSLLPLKANS